jgi:hypothetical protein
MVPDEKSKASQHFIMDKRKLGSFTVIYLLQITAEKMCCIPSYPKKKISCNKKNQIQP